MSSDFDIDAMRQRLDEALEKKGLSMRAASLKADLGPGFAHSIIKDGKEPTVTKLAALCEAAEISLSYILYGVKLSPETEKLIALIEANPEKRDGILALLHP